MFLVQVSGQGGEKLFLAVSDSAIVKTGDSPSAGLLADVAENSDLNWKL